MESRPVRRPESTVDDYADAPEIQKQLRLLPKELQERHLLHIEDAKLSDEETLAYLAAVHEKRDEALREEEVSDPSIREYFDAHKDEIHHALENEVLRDQGRLLGSGMTAVIKKFEIEDAGRTVPFAIKYLVTPTEKTLSASGEHDLILEVERIEKIEQAERTHADETLHLRVPHPYFHYKHGRLQCYGMELVDGIDLQKFMDGSCTPELRDELRASLRDVSRETLAREVEVFFDVMHDVCLHGDIKLANIMVNREGRFYIIDFGQSILANDVDEKAQENFRNLKEDEKYSAKKLIDLFLAELLDEPIAKAA